MNEQLENQKSREEWHIQASVRLSRLAMSMAENFTDGHDAEQTDEYKRLYSEYLQLEADKMQHDAFGPSWYTDYRNLG